MADARELMVHNFSERLLDTVVHFHIMKMKDSLLIWIGKKAELNSLSVAMCTKYVSVHTIGTHPLGH
jgi:proteasome assembly chaperone 4